LQRLQVETDIDSNNNHLVVLTTQLQTIEAQAAEFDQKELALHEELKYARGDVFELEDEQTQLEEAQKGIAL
jgi:chromosome segregation ATPase